MIAKYPRWIAALAIVACTVLYLAALHFGLVHGESHICHESQYSDCEYTTRLDPALVVLWNIGQSLNVWSPTIAALAALAVAGFTFWLWKSTDALRDETKRLAKGAEDQHATLKDSVAQATSAANAAHKAADIAINGQRPWIKVTIIIDGDLTYDEIGCWVWFYQITENVGKTPALRVQNINQMFVPHVIGRHALGDLYVIEEIKHGIERWRLPQVDVGYTIYPDDAITERYRVLAPPDILKAAIDAALWGDDKIRLYLGGIVTYEYIGGKGETPFAYQIFDTGDEPGKVAFIAPSVGNIPKDRLILKAGMHTPGPT